MVLTEGGLCRQAEEDNAVRFEELGLDRRHNRYWHFAAGTQPGAGLIYVELQASPAILAPSAMSRQRGPLHCGSVTTWSLLTGDPGDEVGMGDAGGLQGHQGCAERGSAERCAGEERGEGRAPGCHPGSQDGCHPA